jgi:hypothetical protein
MPSISNCLRQTSVSAISEDHSLNNKNLTEQSGLYQFIVDPRKDTMMTIFQQEFNINKILDSDEEEGEEEKDLYSDEEKEEEEEKDPQQKMEEREGEEKEDYDDDDDVDTDEDGEDDGDEEIVSPYYSDEDGEDDDDESSITITSHVYDSEDENFDDSESDSEMATHPPFWFSHEDPDHIKAIFKCYSEELQIDSTDNNDRRRQHHQLFVGSVKRTKVRNNGDFTTMDEVRVYRQSPKPPGCPLPLDRKYHLLTSWNNDGLPRSVTSLNTQMIAFWSKRALDVSYLFYLPVQSKNEEGIFTVKNEETTVCYSGGPCFRKTPCYEPYLSDLRTESYFQHHLPIDLDKF